MGIHIRFGKIATDKAGKEYMVMAKRLLKVPTNYDYGFDITKPDNWKNFLVNYEDKNGKKLPLVTKEGDKIVYEVLLYGIEKPIREKLGIQGVYGYLCLFPGYENIQTKKRLDVTVYGDLSY